MQNIKRRETNFFQRIDWLLLIIVLILGTISVLMIHSAMSSGQYSTDFSIRQIRFYILGFVLVGILTFIPIQFYKQYIWFIYAIGILSLFFLIILPVSSFTPIINGAKSWYQFGFFSIQPSEIIKVVYILTLAYVISQHNKYKVSQTLYIDLILLFKIFLVSILPMLFILLQNDLGTVLVFMAILLGMIVASGISWWIILPVLFAIATLGVSLILGILFRPLIIERFLGIHPYQFERIYTWLQPEEYYREGGFQLTNSLQAIGSGGFNGKGYEQGIIYIPENHTDFIFTIIGEEFGFIGTTIVILILFIFMLHLSRVAFNAKDTFASYFIIGYLSMVLFHVFQNIGMTIQLLPITGLPLPFLSYGGSFLWANMIAVGIIMSVRFKFSRKIKHKKPATIA